MIIAAAVKIDGVIRALPAPARHHDILHKYPLPEHKHGGQGFIDDQMGFIDRVTALCRAEDEGQISEGQKTCHKLKLFSEDLW